MKVLMICPQYYPIIGGYEQLTHTLARQLNQSGVACSVATRRLNRAWPRYELREGVPIHRLWACPRRGLDGPVWFCALLVFLLLHRKQFDIWHVHDTGWSLVVAVLCARWLGARVVLHPHSGSGATVRKVQRQWSRALFTWAIRRVDLGIALSEEMGAQLRQLGLGEARICYVPNTVDTTLFQPQPGTPKAAAPVLLFVGRLSAEKGVAVLLESWPLVLQQLPGARLRLVGDGPERPALEALCQRLAISDSVEFVGAVRQGIERYYQSATLFVLASFREGVPIALLEAMACGLPVVATQLPAIVQIVEEERSGYLVPVGDSPALAAAIVCGLQADLAAMGQAARAVVLSRFALDQVIGRYLDVYASLLGRRQDRLVVLPSDQPLPQRADVDKAGA